MTKWQAGQTNRSYLTDDRIHLYKFCKECKRWIRRIRLTKHLTKKHGKILKRY